MIGIIDVGGGTRGVYGAGVFDRCMAENIRFDYAIGVSAGAANAAAYCAGQRGRNYVFYTDYAFRKDYMSVENLRRTGSFIGLDYIYSTLSDSTGENPLDYAAMMASGVRCEIVATNALTGEPVYFSKEDMRQDCYDIIKASCCVPFVNKPYGIGGVPYFDGGVSDPVPIDRAFSQGCDKIVLILTKPVDAETNSRRNELAAKALQKQYPLAAAATARCGARYAEGVKKALALQEQGKALIVAPDDIGKLKTLSKDAKVLDSLYNKGFCDAKAIRAFVEKKSFAL